MGTKTKYNTVCFLKFFLSAALLGLVGCAETKATPPRQPDPLLPSVTANNSTSAPPVINVVITNAGPSSNFVSVTVINWMTNAAPAPGALTETNPEAGTLEVKDRLTKLESKADVIEGERKIIDWWIALLAVLTTIIALLGALLPFLMGRKDKELIQQEWQSIKEMKEEVGQKKLEVEGVVSEVKAMRGLLGALETESRRQLASFTSGRPPTDVEADQTRTAIETIKNNPNADLEMKLRAEAVAASQAKQSEKAYSLWRVLSDYCPQDAKVHFNAGYWAHAIAEQLKPSEALRCFKQACAHYQKALELDPGLHQAAYNWASALDDTAKAELMGGDLASARKLWRQAAEKFESALKLKPDLPEAADNWGIALAAEAKAVHESGDLTGARALWRQAGEKFALALKIKDNKDDAAYNWGLALADEAKAISKTDLAAARAVWHEAGNKYELALKIKPDKCVAADSWGNALAAEAAAVAKSNLPNAKDLERTLWEQALAKYQQATEKPDFVNSRFNSACAYAHLGQAKACCDWLAKWKECYPKATKADLDKETDFDGIRGTQEFRVFRDSLPV